jgi:hypothetical protein
MPIIPTEFPFHLSTATRFHLQFGAAISRLGGAASDQRLMRRTSPEMR